MLFNFPTVEVSKNLRMLYALCLLICWLSVVQSFCPCHETISSMLEKSCRITETASPKTMAFATPTATRRRCASLLFSASSDDENEEKTERQWDDEESLLVMNLSPLPNVTPEDSLSRISQYIQSFPFAAVLPVQPLQALPTDDGGLEVKFLRKKTHIKRLECCCENGYKGRIGIGSSCDLYSSSLERLTLHFPFACSYFCFLQWSGRWSKIFCTLS